MFAGAGVFGVYAFGTLTAAISLAITGWLAGLVGAVIYGARAGSDAATKEL
jgi:hypothetical protein